MSQDPARTRTRDRVSGSGRSIAIPDDLGSAVVNELVEQLNAAKSQKTVDASFGDGTTTRVVIGGWRQDVFISDLGIHNLGADELVDADTDIALRYRADGDKDLAAAGTPTEKFFVEGFDGGAGHAAGETKYADNFEAGVLGAAVTTAFAPFVLPANSLLYLEVINNEGGARRLGATVEYAIADGISQQPRNIQNKVFQRVRNFRRRARTSQLGQ